MDKLSCHSPAHSTNLSTASADTEKNSYFADRKIEVNHSIIRKICIDPPPLFNEQVKTLFDIAKISQFSPRLDSTEEVQAFNLWYFGYHCSADSTRLDSTREKRSFNLWTLGEHCLKEIERGRERGRYLCFCQERHKAYSGQKVSGVFTENQRLNKETFSENVSVLLSLAACNLINSQRMLKMHGAQAIENTAKTSLIKKADEKRKESQHLLETANALDPVLTQNQIRSWIIQYAIHNNLINNAGDIEKIKDFRAKFQQKLSDQWFKLLTESGFYQNTEILAYPVILAEQLNTITRKLIKANSFYPKHAYDSACLLFSKYDSIFQGFFYENITFLPKKDKKYSILFYAITLAIFHDKALINHHVSVLMEDKLKNDLEYSRHNLGISKTSKTKATNSSLKNWTCSNNSNEIKLQSLSVKTKKQKQVESTTTWLLEDNLFPEPESLMTAFANIFNVMSYPKTDDKTRIYNMPNHRKRITRAYNILNTFIHAEPPLPENLHGYACFLMGWVQEKQLIDHSSPTEAAQFYEKATERGFFVPTGMKAGDLYVEIGDYPSACRCYEQVSDRLQTLINLSSTERAPEDQSGYLSESFQDFLESKIAYLKIRAKDTAYLRDLTPDEIQRYINGEDASPTPPTASSESVNVKRTLQTDLTEQIVESANLPYPSKPDSQNIKTDSNKEINTFDSSFQVPEQTKPEVLQAKDTQRINKCNLIRNRLTIKWHKPVHEALALFAQRQKQSIYTHKDNIRWLNDKICRNREKKGIEVLREHLAWEHIHIAEQSRFEGTDIEPLEIRKHLNTARDLLLENIIKKTGIQYTELPEPEKFESDVLEIIQMVRDDIKPIEIAEWLFGIVCQARSLGHVFSTFKMLYPGNQNITSLHRGWFSLKRLYHTS